MNDDKSLANLLEEIEDTLSKEQRSILVRDFQKIAADMGKNNQAIKQLADDINSRELNVSETLAVIKAILEEEKLPKDVIIDVKLDKLADTPLKIANFDILSKTIASHLAKNTEKTIEVLKTLKLNKALSDFSAYQDAKNPIAVRLSDGKEFYKAIVQLFERGGGGGGGDANAANQTAAISVLNQILSALGGSSAITSSDTSTVDSSDTNVTLLASNSDRKKATIFNDSTASLYIKLGSTASATDFTIKLLQDDYYEVPDGYTGAIDGIWSSVNGAARITELT